MVSSKGQWTGAALVAKILAGVTNSQRTLVVMKGCPSSDKNNIPQKGNAEKLGTPSFTAFRYKR